MDIGSFPACFTENTQYVRRLNYVRNIITYSFDMWRINFWPHLGHLSIILVLVQLLWSDLIAVADTFAPIGLSQSRPRLQEGHFTKSLLISFFSQTCSISNIPITSFVIYLIFSSTLVDKIPLYIFIICITKIKITSNYDKKFLVLPKIEEILILIIQIRWQIFCKIMYSIWQNFRDSICYN